VNDIMEGFTIKRTETDPETIFIPWELVLDNEVWGRYTGSEERNPSMLSFSEIKAKAEEIAKSLEDHAAGIFHQGVAVALQDIQDVVAKAKADALVVVKNDAPEVQAAVQLAVETVEKAVLAAIQAHLV
jgi:heterodisulfide reductase subunit A-like polyferredoxin